LRARGIRVSNPQNAPAPISFPPPKSAPPPLPYRDHAVATACQLGISPKTCLSCSCRTLLNHGQLWFFSSFPLQRLSDSGNIVPHFSKESLHIFKLNRGTRIDKKQFACNIVEHVVDRGFLLQ